MDRELFPFWLLGLLIAAVFGPLAWALIVVPS